MAAFGRRRRLRAGASAPVLAGAIRHERALKMSRPPQCGNPVPLTPDCSVTVRRLKVADAPLRDRASSNLDPPTADQVRAGCQEDGASVPISLRHRQPTTSLRLSTSRVFAIRFRRSKAGSGFSPQASKLPGVPSKSVRGVESLMGHQTQFGRSCVIPGFRDFGLSHTGCGRGDRRASANRARKSSTSSRSTRRSARAMDAPSALLRAMP